MSTFGKVKGAIYTGAVVGPGVIAFNQYGGMANPVHALTNTLMAYGGVNNGKFELGTLAQMWTPAAAVAVVDLVSTKLHIQSRISKGVSTFLR